MAIPNGMPLASSVPSSLTNAVSAVKGYVDKCGALRSLKVIEIGTNQSPYAISY